MPTRADYAKIHIAKKELQLSDEVYRDILHLKFEVESSSKLNRRQVKELLDHFKALGWQPKSVSKKTKKETDFITIEDGPAAKRQRKILAMWNQLGYPMAKLHSRCKKQFKIERFEWVVENEHLHILITDLEQRLRSKGKI